MYSLQKNKNLYFFYIQRNKKHSNFPYWLLINNLYYIKYSNNKKNKIMKEIITILCGILGTIWAFLTLISIIFIVFEKCRLEAGFRDIFLYIICVCGFCTVNTIVYGLAFYYLITNWKPENFRSLFERFFYILSNQSCLNHFSNVTICPVSINIIQISLLLSNEFDDKFIEPRSKYFSSTRIIFVWL